MKSRMVWVEINSDSLPIRIFRNKKAAMASSSFVALCLRSVAVSEIRHQIFLRSKGNCELCSATVTEQSGHMHEMHHRGKGGEISLENSMMICVKCHKNAHKDRNPKWSRILGGGDL